MRHGSLLRRLCLVKEGALAGVETCDLCSTRPDGSSILQRLAKSPHLLSVYVSLDVPVPILSNVSLSYPFSDRIAWQSVSRSGKKS